MQSNLYTYFALEETEDSSTLLKCGLCSDFALNSTVWKSVETNYSGETDKLDLSQVTKVNSNSDKSC